MTLPTPSIPNLLEQAEQATAKTHGPPLWGKFVLVVLAVLVVSGSVLTVRVIRAASNVFRTPEGRQGVPLLQQLQELVVPPEKFLQGEADDRINVLLLGMGGEGHEGALLTDTIIVASFQPSTKSVGLFSLPRDLVVAFPNKEYRKINAANAYGEQQGAKPGAGALVTKSAVETVIGGPIQYFVRVDFSGFARLVDDVGGVDITVEQAFTDYQYPTEDFGYQTVSFKQGRQHMDGKTALTYVRSRHGNNGEGSDFARSRRQQQVLVALKEKLFSVGTLLNPPAIAKVFDTLGKHVQTNFQPWELMKLAGMGKTVNRDAMANRVLDTTPEGLLANETGIDGAYILVPRAGIGKYQEIHNAFARLFDSPTTLRQATVELQNGTTIAGLAARTALTLRGLPFAEIRQRNAAVRSVQTTVIYDLSTGENAFLLTALKERLGAEVASPVPSFLQPINRAAGRSASLANLRTSVTNAKALEALRQDPSLAGVDYVVILGRDQLGRSNGAISSARQSAQR